MLQSLLAERSGLKVHTENKEIPVFELVVGKTPLKLKETPPEDADQTDPKGVVNVVGIGSESGVSVNLGHGASYTFGGNHFAATKLTMAQFTTNLERLADRLRLEPRKAPLDALVVDEVQKTPNAN